MSDRPKIDRVNFQTDIGKYFRDTPNSPFFVHDGKLQLESPENYSLYTNLHKIDTVIVKVGTSILTHSDYRREIYNMKCIAEDLTRLKEDRKLNALVVSSGAIGLGRKIRLRQGYKIPESEKNSPKQKQLDAIAGQTSLFDRWRTHFYLQPNQQEVVESLVTHDDIMDERKNKKLLSNYHKWLYEDKIPVINEDDAKSLEEIDIMHKGERVFSDNDILASLISIMSLNTGYNPLLVLLTNTDGIYTKESFKNGEYTPIRVIKNSVGLGEQALSISSKRGRGGAISKITAASDAADEGIFTVICNGQYCNHDSSFQKGIRGSQRRYHVLESILSGEVVGTRFLPYDYLHPELSYE